MKCQSIYAEFIYCTMPNQIFFLAESFLFFFNANVMTQICEENLIGGNRRDSRASEEIGKIHQFGNWKN